MIKTPMFGISMTVFLFMLFSSSADAAEGGLLKEGAPLNVISEGGGLPAAHHPAAGVEIGYATDRLLMRQRSTAASRLRMIDGEQASRSYERYLKSFAHPIPEAFSSDSGTKK